MLRDLSGSMTLPNGHQNENNALLPSWHRVLSQRRLSSSACQVSDRFWSSDSQILQTRSSCHSLTLGTGTTLFKHTICPAIAEARAELIFVTCFWAASPSLAYLGDTLLALAERSRALAASSNSKEARPIRVRIYFSSLSIFQKLFHTRSPRGQFYEPSIWASRLGLPSQESLHGLDLEIRSIFFLPFSVIHPKFAIIDRKKVVLPSCNVSWEEWLEGCVVLTGDVVRKFLQYADEGWGAIEDEELFGRHRKANLADDVVGNTGQRRDLENDTASGISNNPVAQSNPEDTLRPLVYISNMELNDILTIFLPSPHHINPRFRLLPWKDAVEPPQTPLNTFLLQAIGTAKATIYMQTPNLTSPPLLQAVLRALRRGVDVEIVTSERLMILEQLVTAGTTTKRCVRKLVKKYKRMLHEAAIIRKRASPRDLEDGSGRLSALGKLKISFFNAASDPNAVSSYSSPSMADATDARSNSTQNPNQQGQLGEPVQSHFKLTVIDDEVTVLGSGNMDRASWYTSRELGIGFMSSELASTMMKNIQTVLHDRKSMYYENGFE